MARADNAIDRAELSFARPASGVLELQFAGPWRIASRRPSVAEVERELAQGEVRRVQLQGARVDGWDSSLVSFVAAVLELCAQRSIEVDRSGMPAGVTRLLALAEAVPRRASDESADRPRFLARIGLAVQKFADQTAESLHFLGELTLALGRLVRGRAGFRRSDLWVFIEDCGARALGIVSLISFLVGLILAFVGAAQLRQFGAGIYVANLVGVAVVREMGAMMTGVIVAGRSGAAFAAQLGTMHVTEEIDALRTFGIAPLDFLVVPRMLALLVMMPLLALYADLIGILGGAVVGISFLDLTPTLYFQQTLDAISLTDVWTGLFKSLVFGALIAFFGCLRGLQCGDDASAVGEAATRAVVAGIVALIVADGAFAVLFNALGL
jgi:phospholipid/cholesterol/gamma-HCH transport system permease protein